MLTGDGPPTPAVISWRVFRPQLTGAELLLLFLV